MRYIAFIHTTKDDRFGVTFPSFPDCTCESATSAEAKEKAQETLEACIRKIEQAGNAVPLETTGYQDTLEAWKLGREKHGALIGFFHVAINPDK